MGAGGIEVLGQRLALASGVMAGRIAAAVLIACGALARPVFAQETGS